jgi:voltage-dependent potassium channel beta subunit
MGFLIAGLKMLYRRLGQTGLQVSAFSYGTWLTFSNLAQREINELVSIAVENGINLFDTAEVYGEGVAEARLGIALQELAVPREKFLLSTKVFWGGNSPTECGLTRKHIVEGCNRSLKRLKLDYIDMYLCHRPDMKTPLVETIIAMNLLLQQGKVLYWGTSEWPRELLIEAYHLAKSMHLMPPTLEQFEYNLFCRERGDIDFPIVAAKTGMGACATMPLACGILAGRYNNGIPAHSRASSASQGYLNEIINANGKNKIQAAKLLGELARQAGITQAQLALNWCLQNQHMSSIILGANNVKQLTENIGAINVKLDTGVLNEIETLFKTSTPSYYEPTYAEVVAES